MLVVWSSISGDSENDDLGKGGKWKHRILICQFWDSKLVKEGDENKNITSDVLVGERGIVQSLTSLGITVDVVQNYKEAIYCLKSGHFNQAWIICS